jgi:hypothetical protein
VASVRDSLLQAITEAVGPEVHVIPFQDNMDVPDRLTVMFKQLRITPLDAAPRGAYVVYYVLTVVSAALDPSVAEAELDEFVPSMLGDLDTLDWFAWDEAVKVLSQSSNLAYDITCWNIAHVAAPATAPPPPTPPRKGQSHG